MILYALVTCLLVGVHMLALMISTCILPEVEATAEQLEFEHQMQKYELNMTHKGTSPASQVNINYDDHTKNNIVTPDKSDRNRTNPYIDTDTTFLSYPHQRFHRFIEVAWISSTVLGIFLFLVEIGLVCYIKFYPISFLAALTGGVVMTPILIMFVLFTVTFYKKLADFKLTVTKQFMHQVDRNLLPLHEHVV